MNTTLILLTIIFTIYANTHYIVSIFKGKTKPHIYSWLIWAIINIIACSIQIKNGAGWGALTLGLGWIICVFVSIVSLWYGEKNITKFDTISFILTLSIIPIWLWTDQDLIAMTLSILIDALSFIPTIRKSYGKPREENLYPYFVSGLSFFISIFLSQEKILVNILYPIIIGCVNFLFIGYIWVRRRIIT